MVETFSEFHETLTLEVPRLGNSIGELLESADAGAHGFIIEVAAIHEGLTANYNHYSGNELEEAIPSWVNPYPKPILLNHNVESCDPIGRVMAARMDKEADGTRYTRLQIAVRDPEAIQKIADQRYLTGSVGGKSDEALCSVCGSNWAEASVFNLPCKHARGKTYKGQLAYLERKGLTFGEYSFVNTPADSRSGVRPSKPEASAAAEVSGENEWTAVARFFDLNMDKEEIMEYTESVRTDLLLDMRRKDALPLYLATKGAFLSALAAEDNDEQESSQVETEDILSVTETLSDDLAGAANTDEPEVEEDVAEEGQSATELEDADAEDATDTEDTVTDSDDDDSEVEQTDSDEVADSEDVSVDDDVETSDEKSEENDLEVSDEAPEEVEDEVLTDEDLPEEPEEASKANSFRAQGQEKIHTKDVDPQARLGGASKTPKPDLKGDKTREDDASADEDGQLDELSVLEARIKQLEEENTKLRTALHRTLAERVVDTKIALGLVEVSEREIELEEHAARSASSLADSLRDLSRMSFTRTPGNVIPSVESGARASGDEDKAHTIELDEVEEEEVVDPLTEAESLFVDALMGRRKL